MEQNYFSEVPYSLKELEHLEALDFTANPLINLPHWTILVKGFVHTQIESVAKRAKAYWEEYKKKLLLSITSKNYEKASRLFERILPYFPLIADGNNDATCVNFRYLIELGINQRTIAKYPQLLVVPPDAFARALRIFKLEVLGLNRLNWAHVNKYCKFFFTSPATRLASVHYLIEFEYERTRKFCYFWLKITRNKAKVQVIRKKIIEISQIFEGSPNKEVAAWMEEYNAWAAKFEERRGRRLIKWV